MDDQTTKDIIQKVAIAAIIGVMGASIRALLAKPEPKMQMIRTFFAGVFMAVLLGIILRNSEMSQTFKDGILAASSAFVSTIWPVFERGALKFFTKKVDNVVSNSNVD